MLYRIDLPVNIKPKVRVHDVVVSADGKITVRGKPKVEETPAELYAQIMLKLFKKQLLSPELLKSSDFTKIIVSIPAKRFRMKKAYVKCDEILDALDMVTGYKQRCMADITLMLDWNIPEIYLDLCL